MDYRSTVMRFGKLHALHRYHIFSMIPDVKTYPGQPPILDYLCDHEYCTQAELADFLHVSPASVAVSVKRMQKAGLIGRHTDCADLRRNRIFITKLGKERNDILKSAFKEIDERFFAGFSEDDIERLNGYLDRIIDNLTDDLAPEDVMSFIIQCKDKKEECDTPDD